MNRNGTIEDATHVSYMRLILKILCGMMAVVCLMVLILSIPAVQRALVGSITSQISADLSTDIRIDRIHFNVLSGMFRVKNLRVSSTIQTNPSSVIEIAQLDINLAMGSLLQGKVVLQSIRILAPGVQLGIDPDGNLLLPVTIPDSDGTVESEPDEAPFSLPPVTISRIDIQGGWFRIFDCGNPAFQVALAGLSIQGDADLKNLISQGELVIDTLQYTPGHPARPVLNTGFPTSVFWSFPGDGTGVVELWAEIDRTAVSLLANLTDLRTSPRQTTQLTVSGDVSPILQTFGVSDFQSGRVDIMASGNGGFTELPQISLSMTGTDILYSDATVSSLIVNGSFADGNLTASRVDADLAGGHLTVDLMGRLLPEIRDIRTQVTLSQLDLEQGLAFLKSSPDIAGTLSGTVSATLAGLSVMDIEAESRLAVTPPAVSPPSGYLTPVLQANVRMHQGQVHIERLHLNEKNLNVIGNGVVDIGQRTYSIATKMSSDDVSPWLDLFKHTGSGSFQAEFSGSGSLDQPRLTGHLVAENLKIDNQDIQKADLSIRAENGFFSIRSNHLEALGIRTQLAASGTVPVGESGRPATLSVTISDTTYQTSPLPALTAQIAFGAETRVTVSTSDRAVQAEAMFSPETPIRASAVFQHFDLKMVEPFVKGIIPDLSGYLTGSIRMTILKSAGFPIVTATFPEMIIRSGNRSLANAEPIQVTLDRGMADIESFHLTGDDGSFIRVSGSAGVDSESLDMMVRARIPDLSVWQPIAGSEYLSGWIDADLQIWGNFTRPMPMGTCRLGDIKLGDLTVRSIDMAFERESSEKREPVVVSQIGIAGITWNDAPVPDTRIKAQIDRGTVVLHAVGMEDQIQVTSRIGIDGNIRADSTMMLDALNLDTISKILALEEPIQGNVTGNLTLSGELSDPRNWVGQCSLIVMESRYRSVSWHASEPIILAINQGGIQVRSFRISGDDMDIRMDGSIGLLEEREDAEGIRIQASVGLKPLLPLVDALDRLDGVIRTDMEWRGVITEPAFTGVIQLDKIIVDGPAFPAPVENVQGSITCSSGKAVIDALQATFAGGFVDLSGSAELHGGTLHGLDISVKAKDLDMRYSQDIQIQSDTVLTISGTWPKLSVSGNVDLNETVYSPKIDFIGILKSLAVPRQEGGQVSVSSDGSSPEIGFNVTVQSPDTIRLENPNVHLIMGVRLQLIGSSELPGILGSANIVHGDINLLRAEFQVSQGSIRFNDPWEIDPDVDIVATTVKQGEEITLRITGKSSQPNMQLFSVSGMSQPEIVKLLVGVPMQSPDEEKLALTDMAMNYATQSLATALAGMLSKQTDLIIIPFPSDVKDEDILFGVGKKIGDTVTIMYYKSSRSEKGDAIELQLDVTPNTNLKARQNQDGTLSGGFRYQHEFN